MSEGETMENYKTNFRVDITPPDYNRHIDLSNNLAIVLLFAISKTTELSKN